LGKREKNTLETKYHWEGTM